MPGPHALLQKEVVRQEYMEAYRFNRTVRKGAHASRHDHVRNSGNDAV